MDRVGNCDEPAELAGVSHFLEHLLFSVVDSICTGHRSGIDAVGGDLNVHVKEYTAFTLEFLPGNSTSA